MLTAAKAARVTATPVVVAEPKGRVLVVDDIPVNRELVSRHLDRRNYACVEAGSGRDALQLLETETFDIVLLDVMMPEMSGIEVLQRIRRLSAQSDLPVIMVTARVEPKDIVEALEHGANDYVTKPINFPVLLARLTNQIERRRAALDLQKSNETLLEMNARLVSVNEQLRDENLRRLRADEQSTYLAYHDPLTGLPNRRACDERLRDCLEGSLPSGMGLAILFVDLDGFKNVNDALGHVIGDMVLHDVAATMRVAISDRDFLVRLGGDEFCVLHVSDNPQASAEALADDLIEFIGRERQVDGQQIFIGASIGIAFATEEMRDASELIKRADLAMYRAKADGRGLARLFQPEMDEHVRQRHAVELDLRDALARGEFELHYQPIIDLETNRISGFEALLRWNRRSRGFVPPDTFIPLAEETGLIVPIGDWALRRACDEAATWPGGIRVAVNVSPVQLRSKHFLASVFNALASSELSPGRLELELTESALLSNTSDNLRMLDECRELGVRLAMDDFGTGYSSLGYFRSFHFDKVKIDKSFISGLRDAKEGRAIVRAVVGLGENFGMTTTAEGVETGEQLEFVRSEGCREVQGYLFSPPQPSAKLFDLIARFNGLP